MFHQNRWAPWRKAYLRDMMRQAEDRGDADLVAGPFLSEYFNRPDDDEANLVVYRDHHGMLVLNRYPYASGHLLAALGDPRPTLLDYEPAQRAAFWKLIEVATELIERSFHPQGINTGINQGRAAGAGLPEHLHAHLVPRWHADTNFITVVGQVRVIPESLERVAQQYRQTLQEMGGEGGT